MKDPTLGRSWAVVASCRHPAWPARLEPASRWKALPRRVPAGSRVTVTAPEGVTSMRLEAKTLTPGRMGQAVEARLIDGARVRVLLTAAGKSGVEAVIEGANESGNESGARWRWK